MQLAQKMVRFEAPSSGTAPGAPLGQATAAKLTPQGRLVAEGGTLQVGVGGMGLQLQNVALSLQVANDGSKLFDGTVSGTVDARSMVALQLVRDVREVCSAVAEAKAACVPCADGAKACFTAAIGGVRGTRIP